MSPHRKCSWLWKKSEFVKNYFILKNLKKWPNNSVFIVPKYSRTSRIIFTAHNPPDDKVHLKVYKHTKVHVHPCLKCTKSPILEVHIRKWGYKCSILIVMLHPFHVNFLEEMQIAKKLHYPHLNNVSVSIYALRHRQPKVPNNFCWPKPQHLRQLWLSSHHWLKCREYLKLLKLKLDVAQVKNILKKAKNPCRFSKNSLH